MAVMVVEAAANKNNLIMQHWSKKKNKNTGNGSCHKRGIYGSGYHGGGAHSLVRGRASLDVVVLAAVAAVAAPAAPAAPAVAAISTTSRFLPISVITTGPDITRYAGSGFLIQVWALLTLVVAAGWGDMASPYPEMQVKGPNVE